MPLNSIRGPASYHPGNLGPPKTSLCGFSIWLITNRAPADRSRQVLIVRCMLEIECQGWYCIPSPSSWGQLHLYKYPKKGSSPLHIPVLSCFASVLSFKFLPICISCEPSTWVSSILFSPRLHPFYQYGLGYSRGQAGTDAFWHGGAGRHLRYDSLQP
jgi:hypothetical protein